MNLRFWMIVIGIVAMIILNAYIIQVEHLEVRTKQEIAKTFHDQLADIISYTKQSREENLARFGFDNKMILLSRKRISTFETI